MFLSHWLGHFSWVTNSFIVRLIDWTARSAAPFDQGEAVEVGKNFIFKGSMNFLNSAELAIPDSLSHLK